MCCRDSRPWWALYLCLFSSREEVSSWGSSVLILKREAPNGSESALRRISGQAALHKMHLCRNIMLKDFLNLELAFGSASFLPRLDLRLLRYRSEYSCKGVPPLAADGWN